MILILLARGRCVYRIISNLKFNLLLLFISSVFTLFAAFNIGKFTLLPTYEGKDDMTHALVNKLQTEQYCCFRYGLICFLIY